MARDDHYASLFGAVFSAYMERPWLGRAISRVVWGVDIAPYYRSMAAIAEVPGGGTIVDCPCGAGPALRALGPGASVRYLAVDLSPKMAERARKRALARGLENVEVLEADAAGLPLPSASADLFLSYWGLHCFEDPAAALAEAGRILKPGGRLVGAAILRGRDSLRQRLLVRPHFGGFGPVGTEADVLAWLAEAGFEAPTRRSGPMLYFDSRLPPEAK